MRVHHSLVAGRGKEARLMEGVFFGKGRVADGLRKSIGQWRAIRTLLLGVTPFLGIHATRKEVADSFIVAKNLEKPSSTFFLGRIEERGKGVCCRVFLRFPGLGLLDRMWAKRNGKLFVAVAKWQTHWT